MATISVIICTRDPADSLRQTLETVAQVRLPTGVAGEVVVVVNGAGQPAAGTESRCGPYALNYVNEPAEGLARARNRGIREARGDVLVFTDDDVRVPANWLEEMAVPLLRDKADALGGSVVLASHLQRPGLTPRMRAFLGCTELVNQAFPERLVGANMSVARRALQKVSGFDEALGAGALGFEEETLFTAQIKLAGMRVHGAPHARVEHHCNPERLARGSFLEQSRRLGRSQAYVAYHWTHDPYDCSLGRRVQVHTGLWRRRLTRPMQSVFSDWPADWELDRFWWLGFYEQYRREVKGPRHYEKCGLRRIEGSA